MVEQTTLTGLLDGRADGASAAGCLHGEDAGVDTAGRVAVLIKQDRSATGIYT